MVMEVVDLLYARYAIERYVGSKKALTYHIPSCHNAKRIKPENLIWFPSRWVAFKQNYYKCEDCCPNVPHERLDSKPIDLSGFECQQCGRCCTEIINGAWIEIYGETLVWWREHPSLFYHPFYHKGLSEIISAHTLTSGQGTVDEIWAYLKQEETRLGKIHEYPLKFVWGGILDQCAFLKMDGELYSCLLHEKYGKATKPLNCSQFPNENSLDELERCRCKGFLKLTKVSD